MKKSEFKQAVHALLDKPVEGLDWERKVAFVHQILVEMDKERAAWDQSRKMQPWSDDELRLILQLPPTKANILRLARAFRRGYGSIEQIYRWAATPKKIIEAKGRSDDRFIQQIKRIASEVGWRAS